MIFYNVIYTYHCTHRRVSDRGTRCLEPDHRCPCTVYTAGQLGRSTYPGHIADAPNQLTPGRLWQQQQQPPASWRR